MGSLFLGQTVVGQWKYDRGDVPPCTHSECPRLVSCPFFFLRIFSPFSASPSFVPRFFVFAFPNRNALGSSLPSRDAPETPVDISISKVEDVSEMFSQFTVTLTLLYAPYFQNKNIVKLRNALNYCGSRHFLMLLVSDMNYEVERQALLEVAIKLQFLWETQHDQQQEDTVEDQEGKHAKPD